MYSNLQEKLKKLAISILVIGTLISIIYGIYLWRVTKWISLLYVMFGSLASWISSWIIYAIGEILSNQRYIIFLFGEIKSEYTNDKLSSIHTGKSWLCECGTRNPTNADRCNACDTPRTNLYTRKHTARNKDDRLR